MKVFAISDLHISLAKPKEMDIFGAKWVGHWEKIKRAWQEKISEEDIVLLAGDLSWAMNYAEVEPDIAAVAELPGKKLLIKGNHDYWHTSLTKTRGMLPEGMIFLQNDAVKIGDIAFAGARGWKHPGAADYTAHDEKVYTREIQRLEMSLKKAQSLGGDIIAMMHYPPFMEKRAATPFTELFEAYGVKEVIYGHVHGAAIKSPDFAPHEKNGVRYVLTSCDYIGFSPIFICLSGDDAV